MRRRVKLWRIRVGFDVSQGVLPSIAKVVHEHRGSTLEGVNLGRCVDGVGVGAIRDGVYDVTGAVLIQLLTAKVKVLHPPCHHFGGFGLSIVKPKHQRTILLKAFLKLNDSRGI